MRILLVTKKARDKTTLEDQLTSLGLKSKVECAPSNIEAREMVLSSMAHSNPYSVIIFRKEKVEDREWRSSDLIKFKESSYLGQMFKVNTKYVCLCPEPNKKRRPSR